MRKSFCLFFALIFAISSSFPKSAVAQQMENIVLLPIEFSPEYAAQKKIIGAEIQKSLSRSFNVFYGEAVEQALEQEYKKEDCTAESCVQNVAILFNGEIVLDASLQAIGNDGYLTMRFLNVLTGELEAIKNEVCEACSASDLVRFVGEVTGNVQLKSSDGFSALLEQQEKEDKEKLVIGSRKSKTEAEKSPSYWRWGLGALVLAAVSGGGGGGGDTSAGSAPTPTPDPTPDPTSPASSPGSGISDEWPNVVAMFRRAEGVELTGVINEDFRLSRSEAQRELLPSVSTDGTELEFSIPSNGGYQVAGASTFDVNDFFDSGSSLYDADFADDVKAYYKTANNRIYLEVEVGAGDTSFGALRYDDTSFPSDISTNRWVAAAFYSGTETPNDIFTSQSNSVSFNGRSAGHLAGHHTVSDIDLNVNFQNQSFTLDSSNTQSTQSIGTAPTVVRTDLDFTITGSISGNGFPASSADIDISGAAVRSLDIRSYGQNLHTLGGGWVIDIDDTIEDYLGVFGAIQ
jgi:hypothetical protein